MPAGPTTSTSTSRPTRRSSAPNWSTRPSSPRRSPGLRLALEEILGRTAIPANAIARQFDAQFGTPDAQFDFVAFLDGQEKAGVAVEAGVEEFRKSWRRPKWHVLVQDPADGGAGCPSESVHLARLCARVAPSRLSRPFASAAGGARPRRDRRRGPPRLRHAAQLRRRGARRRAPRRARVPPRRLLVRKPAGARCGSLRTEELKGVPLRLTFGGRTWDLRSDDEGYFALRGDDAAAGDARVAAVLVEVVGDRGPRRRTRCSSSPTGRRSGSSRTSTTPCSSPRSATARGCWRTRCSRTRSSAGRSPAWPPSTARSPRATPCRTRRR